MIADATPSSGKVGAMAHKAARTSGNGKAGGSRSELMERRLLEVASQLFSERGFTGTSLQDIAEEMGVSRPALYYYAKSKDEILERLVQDIPIRQAADLRAVRRKTKLRSTEKLGEMARIQIIQVGETPVRFRVLERNEHHLSGEVAAAHAKGKRAVFNEFKAVIADGIAAGEFRPVDPRTAALAIIGMCNWVAWWLEPSADDPIGPIADHISEMAVRSVAVPVEGDRTSDPKQVLDQLRQGLDRLGALIR
jgi:AcrR family transcriptional regulator